MKKVLFLIGFAVLLIGKSVEAQVTYATIEEFKEIKGRTLIVEMLEKEQDLIDKWDKKASKTKNEEKKAEFIKLKTDYIEFIDAYNDLMKKTMPEYWKLNSKIEFKTTTEVEALRKSKSKKYAVLWYSQSESQAKDEYGRGYFPNLTIPTLNYGRIEASVVAVDYSFFMPYTGHREKNTLKYGDVILSLKLIQNHINTMIAKDKRKYNFKKYAEDEADENCKELTGKTVFLAKDDIHKNTTIAEIKEDYAGEVVVLSYDEVLEALEKQEDKIIGFCIPHGIIVGQGAITVGRIMYIKAFINTKTGMIYTCKGTVNGEFNDPYFRDKEFKNYGADCK